MTRIVIVGGSHPTAVGKSLFEACRNRPDLDGAYVNADLAWQAPRIWRWIFSRLADKRPPKLTALNQAVLQACAKNEADLMLCAGTIQLTRTTIRQLQQAGTRTAIYLTDDPWSRNHRSRRLFQALPLHDWRITPRQSNILQLDAMQPGKTAYVPFGFDPRYFHPAEPALVPAQFGCEVFFAGGADTDRIITMSTLLEAGIDLHLYGDLWGRSPRTRRAFKGYAPPDELARLIAGARICLCLVRRSNRDGSCMRTFELAAAGACMLVEDTPEHRSLFGQDGQAVRYFNCDGSLVHLTRELLARPEEQQRLRHQVLSLISSGHHTYQDRLHQILGVVFSN